MLLLGVRDDLREAFRRIRRNPRTSLVAVGTLALGIGSATAIFTIAYSFLMAPAPFRAPDRIVEIHGPRNSWGWQGVSGEDFVDYLKEPGLFESARSPATRSSVGLARVCPDSMAPRFYGGMLSPPIISV